MTILTKTTSGTKLNPKGIDPAAVETGAIIDQDVNGNTDRLFLLHERPRRCTSSTLLLILATLCLACMGILIGLVVYRRVQLQRMHFRGMCNLPYDGNFDDNKEMLNALNQRFQDLENYSTERLQQLGLVDAGDYQNNQFFREEFDLDLTEDNSLAKINVPDFRDGRVGRFLHDFKSNQTAIIDESTKRCFVMPLDRDAILPPKSLADVILKMYTGYYDINTTSIRKTMRVVTPAMTNLSTLSPNIQLACDSMSVYRLEKYVGGVVKRSANPAYFEFTGTFVEYYITNVHDLK